MSLRSIFIAVVAFQALALAITGGALNSQSRKVRANAACVSAIEGGFAGAMAAQERCPAPVAVINKEALRAQACDAAFAAKPEDAYAAAAYCSAPVKRVQAERDVARAEAQQLTDTLQSERLDRDGAIARASAAATTQAERKARAAVALQSAPRDGAGLTVCDADCLRARWGGASHRP